MIIKCPKCRAVYDLPDHLMSDEGLKMRCAKCREIWTATPDDALKDTSKNKRQEIQKMFERVSKETAPLFDERPTKVVEKIKVVNVTRYKHTVNFILFFIAILSISGLLYYMRYDIVRLVPEAEKLYDKLNIDSIPHGRNLEFQAITTREFSEDNVAKIEISGAIVNVGNYQTSLPKIKIEVYDKGEKLISETIHNLPLPRLEPGYHMMFYTVIDNPTPYGKSIYVKFADSL